jgi:hypothetical protein
MAELEIHHETEHTTDPTGRAVGILAAMLAVALAIVTISSHRTHTAAIIHKSNANDAWQHYQSSRVKFHNLELGQSLITVFGSKSEASQKLLAGYAAEMRKYEDQGKQIQREAQRYEEAAEADERHALRYDVGEGLLEIALVLSSLYFIARKKMFPVIGIITGIAGIAIALSGLM